VKASIRRPLTAKLGLGQHGLQDSATLSPDPLGVGDLYSPRVPHQLVSDSDVKEIPWSALAAERRGCGLTEGRGHDTLLRRQNGLSNALTARSFLQRASSLRWLFRDHTPSGRCRKDASRGRRRSAIHQSVTSWKSPRRRVDPARSSFERSSRNAFFPSRPDRGGSRYCERRPRAPPHKAGPVSLRPRSEEIGAAFFARNPADERRRCNVSSAADGAHAHLAAEPRSASSGDCSPPPGRARFSTAMAIVAIIIKMLRIRSRAGDP
jgi:hypothetical protein